MTTCQDFFLDTLCDLLEIDQHSAKNFFITESGRVIGFSHIDIFDSMHSPSMEATLKEKIRNIYIILAGYLFATDRIIDGQSESQLEDLLIAQKSIAKAMQLASEIEIKNYDNNLSQLIIELLNVNARALIEEKKYKESMILDMDFDMKNSYERAFLFVTGYRMICSLKNKTVSRSFEEFLMNFLFYMQEGDDLGDWRDDFIAERKTPILKRAMQESNTSDLENVEEFIYLSGFYEKEAFKIIKGLEKCLSLLKIAHNIDHLDALEHFIKKQIIRISTVKSNFQRVKTGLDPIPFPSIDN